MHAAHDDDGQVEQADRPDDRDQGVLEDRPPAFRLDRPVGRCRAAARPGKQTLAGPFAGGDGEQRDQPDERRRQEVSRARSPSGDRRSGRCGGQRHADRLPGEHHAACARALVLFHDVDRKPVDRDVLEGRRRVDRKTDRAEQPDVVDGGAQRRAGQQAGNEHQLRADQPDSPAAHRQEGVAVHDEAVDELEAPRKRGQAEHISDAGGAGAIGRHPRGHREPEKADRHALGDIEQENREQPELATLRERRPCRSRVAPGGCGLIACHAVPPNVHKG